MAFLKDLFKPKWQHRDVNKRLKAVALLQAQDLLLAIALNDSSFGVRAAALKRLQKQADIYTVASDGKEVDTAEMAAGLLKDQALLEKIVRGNHPQKIKMAALRNLENDALKLEMFRADGNESNRLAYLECIKGQGVLNDLIRDNTLAETLRLKALNRMENQNSIAALARDTVFPDVMRIAAVKKIASQDVIKRLAQDDASSKVREAAQGCIRREWKEINTEGRVFPSYSSNEQRVANRFGGCKDCRTVYALKDTVPYKATWDRHFAFFYFCPKCNPHPNPKGTQNWYDGNIIGQNEKQIIDQVEF